MITAEEAWKSLYTKELESIWKSEIGAMRKSVMLHYVLSQELKKLQDSTPDEIKLDQQRILSIEEPKSHESREDVPLPLFDSDLDKSPPPSQRYNFNPTSNKESILYNLLSVSPTCEILETKSKSANAKETFYSVTKETSSNSENKIDDMCHGYNLFPISRPRSPIFVRRTEPAPSEADDFMQLSGWPCEDCKNLDDNCNLPPGELRTKLTVCSKHRKQPEPCSETFEAFPELSDVEMLLSQEYN